MSYFDTINKFNQGTFKGPFPWPTVFNSPNPIFAKIKGTKAKEIKKYGDIRKLTTHTIQTILNQCLWQNTSLGFLYKSRAYFDGIAGSVQVVVNTFQKPTCFGA